MSRRPFPKEYAESPAMKRRSSIDETGLRDTRSRAHALLVLGVAAATHRRSLSQHLQRSRLNVGLAAGPNETPAMSADATLAGSQIQVPESSTVQSVAEQSAALAPNVVDRPTDEPVVEQGANGVEAESSGKGAKLAQCTFKPAKRKGQTVLYDEIEKQSFKKNKKSRSGQIAYTCCVDGCKARIIRHTSGQCFYANDYKDHNHYTTSEKTVADNAVKALLKERAKDLNHIDKLPSLRSIFQDTVSK